MTARKPIPYTAPTALWLLGLYLYLDANVRAWMLPAFLLVGYLYLAWQTENWNGSVWLLASPVLFLIQPTIPWPVQTICVAPIWEEVIFRRLGLGERRSPNRTAFFGALFLLSHGWIHPGLTLMTILLSALYYRKGTLPCILLHSGYNGLVLFLTWLFEKG